MPTAKSVKSAAKRGIASDLKRDADAVVTPLRQGAQKAVKAAKTGATAKTIKRTADKAKQTTDKVTQDVQAELHALSKTVKDAIVDHPYAALGAAFAIGLLVAGAISTRRQ